MSDPRNIDPRYTDPQRPPGSDPNMRRRLDLETPSSDGSMWTWIAALVAIVVIIGLAIGYNRTEEARNQPNQPTTTGAAPATPRPMAPTNPANTAPPAAPAVPVNPTPAPATPAPAEAPH
jgi:hypothetical protein